MDVFTALTGRRSLRRFAERPVAHQSLERLLTVACLAPAPHHSRPWRFVVVGSRQSRQRLAEAMGQPWRLDLKSDGVPPDKIAWLLERSRRQIMEAPALILGCLVPQGLRPWPDERRRQAEWAMAVQSMGAALENLMLAAHALGLASFWISAPLFCPETVREALDLPEHYVAQALIALGYPAPDVAPRPREEPSLADLTLER